MAVTPKERKDALYLKDAADAYVLTEPVNAADMAAATTGDVLTVKADDTVHPRTITGAGGIAITVSADEIEVDGSAISAGASGLVLLDTQTASASASLDFTTDIDATYDAYFLQVGDIVPATDGADLLVRFSTDGGSSYFATNYNYALRNFFADAFDGEANSTSANGIPIGTSLGNGTGEHWNANVWLNNLVGARWRRSRHGHLWHRVGRGCAPTHHVRRQHHERVGAALRLRQMTANDERLIGRLTKAVGWGALGLVIAGTLAFTDLKATAADAKKEAAEAHDVSRATALDNAQLERRFDSLLIELRHLPRILADTLEARERGNSR
jgi:hypothetical protein